MKIEKLLVGTALVAGLAVVAAACGDEDETDDPGTPDSGVTIDMGTPDSGVVADSGVSGFEQPDGTVAVNFYVDDRGTRSITEASGLAWKGQMSYDAETRIGTDGGWSGPFAPLYDDGPWNEGGHEPAGATADDGIWGITAFVEIPTDADLTLEYGLITGSVDGSDGEWIWNGQNNDPQFAGNGSFTIPVGASEPIDAGYYTMPGGDIDFRLTMDMNDVDADFIASIEAQGGSWSFDPNNDEVRVKASWWGWNEIVMTDDGTAGDMTAGDGVWTFVLSQHNEAEGVPLFGEGNQTEFVIVFGIGDTGVEYKDGEGVTTGVTAAFSHDGGSSWTNVAIGRAGNDNNPAATAPAAGTPFEQPAGTVAVNFYVDDRGTGSITEATGLAWKGQMSYDAETRIGTDGGWSGPFAPLYDDGPWNQGGHEPAGATAGDSIWGITAFIATPVDADLTLEYGLITGSVDGSDGEWIWNGQNNDPAFSGNGSFTVPIGATEPIDAGYYTMPGGNIDFRLTMDMNDVDADFIASIEAQGGSWSFDPNNDVVRVKASWWGWNEIVMTDDGTAGDMTAGDGVWTFVLSQHNEAEGVPLFGAGNQTEFVIVFGIGDTGVEYKDGEGVITGVTAAFSEDGSTWTDVTIGRAGNDNNPAATAPGG